MMKNGVTRFSIYIFGTSMVGHLKQLYHRNINASYQNIKTIIKSAFPHKTRNMLFPNNLQLQAFDILN